MSAATFLNLSGFASLRDTAVLEAREEFFTLRRQGAKKTNESERRISSLNLSVFASLREISVTQGGEEFFTLRREGAKNTCGSKHRISFRDLSGFASLREISAIEGRQNVPRQGAKTRSPDDRSQHSVVESCKGERLSPWPV
jgi:hypothetical protein